MARPWGALSQAEAMRLAASPDTGPLHVRVFFAAAGRANTTGHAEFASGELARILRGATGTPRHRTHLANAIRRAIAAELLLPGSGSRCLRPSPVLWDRAGGQGTRTCTWHRLNPEDEATTPPTTPRRPARGH